MAISNVSTALARSKVHYPRPCQGLTTSNGPKSRDRPLDEAKDIAQPQVEELRQARAEYYSAGSEHRRKTSTQRMASHGGRRGHSGSKASSVRDSEVTVREVRRERVPAHRDQRPRSKHIDRDEDEVVYIYKHSDGGKREREPSRPHPLRRTSETVSRIRLDPPKPEKRRLDIITLPREDMRRERIYSRARGYEEPSRAYKRRESVSSTRENRPVLRSASTKERPSAPPPLQSIQRSKTSASRSRYDSLPSAPAPPAEAPDRAPSIRGKPQRPASIFGSIFGSSKPSHPPPPERVVECLTCMSDVPVSKSAKLACGHRMCHGCLRRIFTMSVTDPQHMPPKCCTNDHIPLKHVDKLFDIRFKMKWNQKYQEYTTKNRVYCPAKGCGEWIKPANIHIDTSGGANGGRKYGRCSRCRTKVCCACNGRWHSRRECPKDEATARFAEIAKKEGWQRCFNCSAFVELKEGCNHMTCRCRAEFCMICGAKWKTCDCPWFNYDTVENDRLNHMQIPQAVPRRMQGNPALGYQEELDRRREQERADEALARRIQGMALEDEMERHPRRPGANNNNNVHEYLVQPQPPALPPEIIRRAQDMLSGNYGHAQADPNRMSAPRPPMQHQPAPRSQFAGSRPYHSPAAPRGGERMRYAPDPPVEELRSSTLAGLSRAATESRVDAWRRHVAV